MSKCVHYVIDEIAFGHLVVVRAITISILDGIEVFILIQYPLVRHEVGASEIEWVALHPCFDDLAVPFRVARR